jgi:hypothetical protein
MHPPTHPIRRTVITTGLLLCLLSAPAAATTNPALANPPARDLTTTTIDPGTISTVPTTIPGSTTTTSPSATTTTSPQSPTTTTTTSAPTQPGPPDLASPPPTLSPPPITRTQLTAESGLLSTQVTAEQAQVAQLTTQLVANSAKQATLSISQNATRAKLSSVVRRLTTTKRAVSKVAISSYINGTSAQSLTNDFVRASPAAATAQGIKSTYQQIVFTSISDRLAVLNRTYSLLKTQTISDSAQLSQLRTHQVLLTGQLTQATLATAALVSMQGQVSAGIADTLNVSVTLNTATAQPTSTKGVNALINAESQIGTPYV